jgi:hypothetical protein
VSGVVRIRWAFNLDVTGSERVHGERGDAVLRVPAGRGSPITGAGGGRIVVPVGRDRLLVASNSDTAMPGNVTAKPTKASL